MGCHTLTDRESGEACFYCSCTGWAFGPIFPSYEAAERFLEVYAEDPRNYTDAELRAKFAEFSSAHVCECGGVSGEEDAESKASAMHPEGCTCGNNGGGDCPWCMDKEIILDWTPQQPGERFVCYWCERKEAEKRRKQQLHSLLAPIFEEQ
jgi:hypothetical protein